jgi:hypothetical protein
LNFDNNLLLFNKTEGIMTMMEKRSMAAFLRGWLTLVWWLALVAALLIVAVLGAALVTGKQPIELMGVPIDFRLDPSVYDITPRDAKDPSAAGGTIDDASGMLQISSWSRASLAAYLCIVLVYAAVILFVLQQLRRVFRSLAEGKPFSLENAARIRLIGLLFIFGEVAESVLEYAGQLYVGSAFVTEGLTIHPRLDLGLSAIFGGLVLLVIAEVFRLGARLQEDQDLTV